MLVIYCKSHVASLGYKLVLVLLAGWGLFLTSGLPQRFSHMAWRYYTTQSNALCLVYFVVACVRLAWCLRTGEPRAVGALLPRAKGAITMAITVTMLVYQFVLAETPFSLGNSSLSSQLLHLVVPLMVILDWLLFDPKGSFCAVDPFLWCAIPLVYFSGTVVAAQLGVTYYGGARYPYLFMDFDRLDAAVALRNIGLLLVAFLVLNWLVYGLDKWLARFASADDLFGMD